MQLEWLLKMAEVPAKQYQLSVTKRDRLCCSSLGSKCNAWHITESMPFHFAGALHTHKSLRTQIRGLCEAWAWQKNDRILHALPLHHVHGIINALYCAHYSGACVEFMPKFSPDAVWDRLKVCAAAILLKDREPVVD